jgi:hypothetical protein
MSALNRKEWICRWCLASLKDEPIKGYPHPSGWRIEGLPENEKYWLYVECPECGYQWALWKLGVKRDAVIPRSEVEAVIGG